MILDERENRSAICREIRYHVGLTDDELSIQDVVVGVVAMVDDKGEVNHHTGGVALAVGAGIGFIGRHTVVGKKLVVTIAVDDDTTAGALKRRGDIFPTAHKPKVVVLVIVQVDLNRVRQDRPVRIFGILLATVQEGKECY